MAASPAKLARVAILIASLASLRELPAQVRPDSAPSRPISLIADSVAVAGDSVAALAMLDSVVRVNRRDASALHRFGMLAWGMTRSSRSNAFISSREKIRLLIAADSALHLATAFAPDSAIFWRDLGRFSLNSGNVFLRFRAQDYMRKGLNAATKVGDSLLVAELADERGMVMWRRYETAANRALVIDGNETLTKGQIKRGVKDRRDQLVEKPNSFSGFTEYMAAAESFGRATRANPLYPRARRHLYMALAERKQWPELLQESLRRLASAPLDFEAWLARGLASQRMGRSRDAAAAFDSALTYMTPVARAEYTRVTRIFPPKVHDSDERVRDAATFVKLPKTEQEFVEAMLWATVDPLAATDDNEYRTEFYARVAFADLRWTSDDLDRRGANTDRGDIHIRYGPPDRELGSFDSAVWRYNIGLTFTFVQPPTFGTAYFGNPESVEQIRNAFPVSWNNVPITRLIDTMPVRVTAFRSNRDSLDIVVASDVPVAKMLTESELAGRLPFEISTRILDGRAKAQSIKSSNANFSSDSAPVRAPQNWIHQVGPGVNVVRVDAYQRDLRRIARGIANVDAARPAGFGMSDLLLGGRPVESTTAPERWRDVNMQPGSGTFRTGDPIGLVWENYHLTPQDGDLRYRVNITVKRQSGEGVRGLIARVRGGFGNALLGQANGDGDIAISFPRTAPGGEITVESLTLDLGNPSPGRFRLRIEVTDLATQRTTFRETEIRVVE